MSGQEDFVPLLEALVACVGVMDVISLFAFMFNRKSAKEPLTDVNKNEVALAVRDRAPIADPARLIPQVVVAPPVIDGVAIESLLLKVNELEAKVTELEIKSREGSMERFVEMERLRRSCSPSPYPVSSGAVPRDDESSSYDEGETNTSSSESRSSSEKRPLMLITRDDEFRKTVKRSSQMSHDEREEELMEFTKIEKAEADDMDDFVPITYEGQDDTHYRHGISPIQEVPSCPIHGEIEGSPEPGISGMTDKPWGDIRKDASELRKLERRDQMRRSQSIDEQPAAEIEAAKAIEKQQALTSVDVNEQFIKMEQNILQQQHAKLLVKQEHVVSEDQPEETTLELKEIPLPVVEIFNEPTSVTSSWIEVNIAPVAVAEIQNETQENPQGSSIVEQPSSATENDFAVRSATTEPDVSMNQTSTNDAKIEVDLDAEVSNISGSPTLGEGLKRTKRCTDSLDRSISRSSSRVSRSRKIKSPSVASQEDYKDWFDKFDNHINPDLTVPGHDDDDFDSDIEEEFLMHIDDGNLNGAEICKIEDDDEIDTTNVSVSVTLNLKKLSPAPVECFPCNEFQDQKVYKTKAEEFLELERFRENQTRRVSIVPLTDEQQSNYLSNLHPEEFPKKVESAKKEPHQHHEHLRNVGYHEWMNKLVDHHSCHLAMSDSDSDSEPELDEVRMLPLFCDERQKI